MPDHDVTLSVGLDIGDIQSTAESLQEEIRGIFTSTSGQELSKPFQSLLSTLDKLYTRSTDISQKMEELGTKQIPTNEYVSVQKEIDSLNKKLETAKDRLEKFEALGGKQSSKTWESINYDIANLEDKLYDAEREMQSLVDTGRAFTLGSDTPEYDRLATQLSEVNNRTVTTIAQLNALEDSENNTTTSTITLNQGLINLEASVLRAGAQLIKTATSIPIRVFERIGITIGNCAKNAAKLASNAISSGIKKLSSSITGLGKSSSGTEQLMKKGLKMLLRYGIGVRSFYFLFRKIRSAIKEGFKDIAQVHEPFNVAISNIITAFNGLKASLSAAFAPIVQYVEPILVHFMNIISEVISKIGMLAAALTGKEFVKAIPVQQDYADSLTTTAQKEQEARKALQAEKKELEKNRKEQKKLQKAMEKTIAGFDDLNILKDNKDDDDDYDTDNFNTDINIPELPKVNYVTQPIDNAFKDLADKLKAMFRKADFTDLGRLLGEKLRDALNKIPWDKIQTTLKNIARSIATFLTGFLGTPGLFTAVGTTIAEALNSAFVFLGELVHDFPWPSLGNAIKDLLLGALTNIRWEQIYQTMRELGGGIGTALDTALNNPEVWTAIGTTLINQIRAILFAFNEFVSSIRWLELGTNISTGIRDSLLTIDWMGEVFPILSNFGSSLAQFLAGLLQPDTFAVIGYTLAQLVNGAFQYLYSFIQEFPWETFGLCIKEGILGFLGNIDWPLIYATMASLGSGIGTSLQSALNDPEVWNNLFEAFSNGITAVLILVQNFLTSIDWIALGANIGNGMNTGVEKFPWSLLADTLITLINSAFDLWYSWVTTFDFLKFGEYIGTTLSQVIRDIDWKKGGSAVGATITALFDTLTGIVSTTDWGALGKAVVDAIAGFLNDFNWGSVSAFISSCIIGLYNFLIGALQTVHWTDVPQQILDKVGEYLGGFDFTEMASKAMELLGTALKAAIQLVAGLGSTIAEWIKKGLTEIWDYFGTSIDDCGGNIALGILQGIINVFKGIVNWIHTNIFTPFVDAVKSVFDINSPAQTMLEFGEYIIEGILTGIINVFKNIVDWVNKNIFAPFVSAIKSIFGIENGDSTVFLDFGKNIINGLLSGITNILSTVSNWISKNVFEPITKGFKTLFGIEDGDSTIFSGFGENIIGGLFGGLLDKVKGVKDWISNNIFKPFTSGFKSLFGLEDGADSTIFSGFGENIIGGLFSGLQDKISGVTDWISSNIFEPFTSGFKTLFGIGDGNSSIFSDFGGDLIEGLKDGLVDKVSGMADWLDTNVTSKVCGFFKDLFGINSPSKVFTDYGGYLMEGLEDGIDEGTKDPMDALATAQSNMMSDFGSYEKLSEWIRIGSHLMSMGLKAGIETGKSTVTSEMSSLITTMEKSVTEYNWSYLGDIITAGLYNGIFNGYSSVTGLMSNIISDMQNGVHNTDWAYLGDMITSGIYNGISRNWEWLKSTTWNLAVEMYNSACDALGIASPSKQFAWIGEMVDKGLGSGIKDNKDIPIDTAKSVAEDIIDTANDVDPTITLDTQLTDTTQVLANVLDNYSATIVNSFTDLIATLNKMADLPNSLAISQGRIVPYSALNNSASQYSQSNKQLEDLSEKLDTLIDTRITQSDIIDIVRRYLSWSIGDEQIARHANAGNAKLDRRLHPVRGGA